MNSKICKKLRFKTWECIYLLGTGSISFFFTGQHSGRGQIFTGKNPSAICFCFYRPHWRRCLLKVPLSSFVHQKGAEARKFELMALVHHDRYHLSSQQRFLIVQLQVFISRALFTRGPLALVLHEAS